MPHQLRILKINLSILTIKKIELKKKKHMYLDLTPSSSRIQKSTNPKKNHTNPENQT